MPQTNSEKLVYGIMMVICMVYGMICYNISLSMGGLQNIVFLLSLKELIIMAPVAFIIESLFVSKIAFKKATKIVDIKKDNPFMLIIMISIITVMLMCPIMSLIATIIFHGIHVEIISTLIQKIFFNFPMALCYQLFVAGPLVRFIFKKIFR